MKNTGNVLKSFFIVSQSFLKSIKDDSLEIYHFLIEKKNNYERYFLKTPFSLIRA